ncbi:MAG TPA: class I SAM-dependent methyltransferase [Bacteroidota bacterium]|nr:class I SAM-dependent methyltransferase [Bacteroidota bacterium]
MGLWKAVSSQFGKPSGLLGIVAGMIMAKRASNKERILWAISCLNLHPNDRVLEIGFGPGIAIQKMNEIITKGAIWGIDHSEVMFEQASKRNRAAISEGKVTLLLGSASSVLLPEVSIDKILDVNSFQFWESQVDDLKRIMTHLSPGGLIVLAHQPRNPGSTDADTDRAGRLFADCLVRAGCRNVSIEKKIMKPVSAVCVLGRL